MPVHRSRQFDRLSHGLARIQRGVGVLLHKAEAPAHGAAARQTKHLALSRILPLLGGSMPRIRWASVDLPDPDLPTIASVLPRANRAKVVDRRKVVTKRL